MKPCLRSIAVAALGLMSLPLFAAGHPDTKDWKNLFAADLINTVEPGKWSETNKNPDGTPNKFFVALKDYARKGPIGLQGLHGAAQAPVYYRNLKIKSLD